jgi:hypothetical protein
MDIQKILAKLHEEHRQVNEAILILERLAQGIGRRKGLPAAMNLQGVGGGKWSRMVGPATRAKVTPRQRQKKLALGAKAAGN